MAGGVVYSGEAMDFVQNYITDFDTRIPEDAEIIDIAGKYRTPGLIDAHVHLSATGLAVTRK